MMLQVAAIVVWGVVCLTAGLFGSFLLQLRQPKPMSEFLRWWGLFSGIMFAVGMMLYSAAHFYVWANELIGRDPWQI